MFVGTDAMNPAHPPDSDPPVLTFATMAPMDLPAPFRPHGDHIAADLPGGTVLFSTRRGGVSNGPFASLNLGRLTDDTDAHVEANRERLATAVGRPRERFLYGRQVHEATVRRATEPPGPARPAAEEDGQATALEDAAALVFTADCLPVMLVADGAVAALHGGWRGLAGGIVAEGVAAVSELGAGGSIRAALGPSARGCCYEVSEDVHAHFADHDARVGARHLDIATVARAQLEAAGVTEVHDVGLCTICADPALFFSHRRDRGVTGRQAGVVWRA
jgi:YfiH family protein